MQNTSTREQTVVGVFDDQERARRCVEELEDRGFDRDQIGFLGPNRDQQAGGDEEGRYRDHAEPTMAVEDAGKGALAGSVTGGVLGAIAAGLIPGIGPVLAAGALGVALAGPAGAAIGGIAGALRGAGVDEKDAGRYGEEVGQGRTLVTVRAAGREQEAAECIRACDGEVRSGISNAVSRATGTEPSEEQPYRRPGEATGTMPLHTEEPVASTTPRQTGEAVLGKEVHTEQRSLEVPVTREEAYVETRPVEPRAVDEDVEMGDGEARVPLSRDEVNIDTRTVQHGEAVIRKRPIEDTETHSTQVRREEPTLRDHGSTDELEGV